MTDIHCGIHVITDCQGEQFWHTSPFNAWRWRFNTLYLQVQTEVGVRWHHALNAPAMSLTEAVAWSAGFETGLTVKRQEASPAQEGQRS
jgi:hypothetical protein